MPKFSENFPDPYKTICVSGINTQKYGYIVFSEMMGYIFIPLSNEDTFEKINLADGWEYAGNPGIYGK